MELQIDAFTGDYSGALSRAVALDQKILNAAAKISSQYSDIVSLAMRQAMGTFDITAGTDSNGNLIASDVKVFMKNLGTDQFVFFFPLRAISCEFRIPHTRLSCFMLIGA